MALDPADIHVLGNTPTFLRNLGRLNEALALQEALLLRDPVNVTFLFNYGLHLRNAGRLDEAIASLRTVLSLRPGRGGAHAHLDAAFNIAYVFAFRAEPDKAFEWLDKAVAYQDPGLEGIVAESLFERIRSDPRWLPFLRRIGKAPEQLAKIEFRVTIPT